jgi:hypothetical protein
MRIWFVVAAVVVTVMLFALTPAAEACERPLALGTTGG